MSEFQEFLNEQLHDDEFRKEWEDIQSGMNAIKEMDDEEQSMNMIERDSCGYTF